MKKRITIFFIGSLLAGFCGIASSQGQNDSLSFYLRLAAKNNPTVLQRFTEYKAALEKIPQVSALPDPELGIDAFLSPMELVSGNLIGDLNLMQMFPWFGTLRAAKDEMSLMAKANYETFREVKLQVFYDVQKTWYEFYEVQQDIRISEKSLGILKSLERLSLASFNSGRTMESGSGGSGLADLYRVQIEIAGMENNIAELQSRHRSLTVSFNSLINRPPLAGVSVPDTITADTLSLPLNTVLDSMLVNNPMIMMLDYERQSLDARKEMVTRMGYPMIGLGLNYSLISRNAMSSSSMNGKDMIMPMAKITLPIYRKKYRSMQNEASLMEKSAGYNRDAVSNSLEAEYYIALQSYQDALRRVKLYSVQLELANRSLSVLLKSFASSGADLTEVLQTRQQTLDYELKSVEAVTDCNTSLARIRQLMASEQGF
jgi:outer membrane protein TolC